MEPNQFMAEISKFVLYGLSILVGLYGLIVVFMYLIQERLVYFPAEAWQATPADIGLPFEDLRLTTADGVTISAWFIPPATDHAQGTVLFFHGNGGNISHRLDSVVALHQLNLNVMLVDYRGYGQSEGRPSEQGTYRDGEAAWEYLLHQPAISADSIIIWGNSLGGGVASWLAETHRPAALVLAATFTSAVDMAQSQYPFLPVRPLAKVRYETINRLPQLDCPILIVHSPHDEIIPYHHGQTLFAAASEPKQFLEIHGGHNSNWLNQPTYLQRVRPFIEQALTAQPD